MLLSDRDLLAAIAAGSLRLDPFDDALVQPSSIDVRLDRFFRVFANHRYTHIDPALAQDDLTELVETDGEEPFILHPGEFVLGSTFEVVSLDDTLASRLEGKALALDTEVPTTAGWTTMGELAVGNLVFDQYGVPTPVLAATEVLDDRPCFAVRLSDGSSFVADARHQWVTQSRGGGTPGRITTTEQLAADLAAGVGHEIAGGGTPGGPEVAPRAVVSVLPVASVPVRCVQVAADSGTFLIGQGRVPTHNSSLGRLGLLTHSTAGFIDPGFSGHVTLELSNVANLPIKLYPGMKIGQVCVFRLSSPSEHPYGSAEVGSRYQGQRGPTPSRSHLRFTRTPTR